MCKGRHNIQGLQGKGELEAREKLFEEYDKMRLRKKGSSIKSYIPWG